MTAKRTHLLGALLRKELTETLRDRRTLLMMVGVPLVLYPAMVVLMGQMMSIGKSRLAQQVLSVGILGRAAPAFFEGQNNTPKLTRLVPLSSVAEAIEQLQSRQLEAAVVVPEGAVQALAAGQKITLELLYHQRQESSLEARRRLEDVFRARAETIVRSKVMAANLPEDFTQPMTVSAKDVGSEGGLGALVASKMLPVMLVAMLFLGAFHTAIDVTAGEKERGTLETLLVAPLRPWDIMAAKWVTAFTVCMGVTLLNLGSLSFTLAVGIRAAEDGLRAQLSMSASQMILLGVSLIPSAALISAVALTVASLARTYREGQHLLSPLLVVGLVPPIVALMPGLELAAWNAWIPLLNISLLMKAVILETWTWGHLAIVLVSGSLCAGGGLWLAGLAFQSEDLRLGGVESWRELLWPETPKI